MVYGFTQKKGFMFSLTPSSEHEATEKTPDRTWHRLKTVSGTEEVVCNKLQEHKIPCYCPSVRVKSNDVLEQ